MHMKIQKRNQAYILGQFSKPFKAIAEMLLYYSRNSLPVKGAEHISLKKPVCEQLLWIFIVFTIYKLFGIPKDLKLRKTTIISEFTPPKLLIELSNQKILVLL